MVRAVRRRYCLTRSPRRGDCRLFRGFSRCGVSLERRLHRHARSHFTIRPGAADLDGAARSIIVAHFRKEMKRALRAICCPVREKGVAGGIQRTAAVSSNEASVAHARHSAAFAEYGKSSASAEILQGIFCD